MEGNKIMSAQEKTGFWIQWVLLSGTGWFLGFIPGSWIGGYIGVGVAQWYILRHVTPRAGWWLGLTAVGGLAGWFVSTLVVGILTTGMGVEFMLISSTVEGGLIGFALGLMQWFFLRRLFNQTELWIGASIVGWALGPFLGMRVVWYGPVAAAITGLALVWLLKQPRPGAELITGEAHLSEQKTGSIKSVSNT